MRRKVKVILSLFIVLLVCYLIYQPLVERDDVYVNRYVYLKKNGSLFTGTLKINDPPQSSSYSFCNGLPCGKWEYRFNGDLIQKGEYIDKIILSKETQKLLAQEIFVLDYWQEGELPNIKYSPFFTVIILKNDKFFSSERNNYDRYIQQLANMIFDDTRKLNYYYLEISFVNALYDWTKVYSKEYKIKSGKLLEIKE
jgi:hypothetical protein